MDDFLYAEPTAALVPEPTSMLLPAPGWWAWSPVGVGGLERTEA